MNEEMVQDALDFSLVAVEKFTVEKDIAAYIKKVRRFRRGSDALYTKRLCRSLTRSTE